MLITDLKSELKDVLSTELKSQLTLLFLWGGASQPSKNKNKNHAFIYIYIYHTCIHAYMHLVPTGPIQHCGTSDGLSGEGIPVRQVRHAPQVCG